jgi:hypothetical protein
VARNRALVADLGQPMLTWAALHHQATLRVLHCETDADEAIVAAMAMAPRPQELWAYANSIPLRMAQGRAGELEEWGRLFAERIPSPFFRSIYATILAESGQIGAAAHLFDEFAASDFAHPPNNAAWLWFNTGCAHLCARLGRAECVPRLRPVLEPYADQLIVSGFAGCVMGSVSLYLGLLATTVGDWPDAEARFAAAAATHERIGAPGWLARTRLEWARMLLARAQPKDAERAHDLLRQALATACELGLAKIERETTELLSGS